MIIDIKTLETNRRCPFGGGCRDCPCDGNCQLFRANSINNRPITKDEADAMTKRAM